LKQHGNVVAGRKIEIVRRDDGGISPENSRRMAMELIIQDRVDLLAGLIFTPNALAVGQVSTNAKVPTFIMSATTSKIMAANPYMCRYSETATQQTVPLAQYAYKSGSRKVFIMFQDYGPGIDSGNTFEKTFTDAGGMIVGKTHMPLGATDFAAYLQRAKDAKPDSIYFYLNGDAPIAFLKQAKAAQIGASGIRLFSTGASVEEQILPAIGDDALGLITAMNYSASHKSAKNQAFVEAYKKISGGLLPNFSAVGVYDTMTAMYAAIEAQKGQLNPDTTMALVKSMKFESPRGPIAIDPVTRDIVQNMYIRRTEMKDGQLVNTEIYTYPMFKDPSE
jgi:branched-chain amino acid transport system substrate-binding protein